MRCVSRGQWSPRSLGLARAAGRVGLAGLAVLALAAPAQEPAVLSTRIWAPDCEVLYADEARGDISELCDGPGGYRLVVHESDLRQSVDVVTPAGEAFPLGFWHHVTPLFSHLEERVRWQVDGTGSPRGLLLRLHTGGDFDREGAPAAPIDLAVRLGEDGVCLVGERSGASPADDPLVWFRSVLDNACRYGVPAQAALVELHELQAGDRGCYLLVADERPGGHGLLGVPSLCQQRESLVGRPVYLTYLREWIASPRCEGDPACDEFNEESVVSRVTVLASETCPTNAVPVFACDALRACWDRNTATLAVTLPGGRVSFAGRELTGGAVPFAGGGGTWLTGTRGDVRYTLFSAIGRWGVDGQAREVAGLDVSSASDARRRHVCATPPESLLGPAWYQEEGFAESSQDYEFIDGL